MLGGLTASKQCPVPCYSHMPLGLNGCSQIRGSLDKDPYYVISTVILRDCYCEGGLTPDQIKETRLGES